MYVIYSILEMPIKEQDNWNLVDEIPPINKD